jgi:hypothetical protein
MLAIAEVEPDARLAAEILELVRSLGRKERALCLFNADFLRNKVAEAKEVLALQDDADSTPPTARAPVQSSMATSFARDTAIATPPRAHSAPIEPGSPHSTRSAAKKASQLGLVTSSTPVSPAGSSVISAGGGGGGPDVQSLEAAAAALDLADRTPSPLKSIGEIASLSARDALAYLREHEEALGNSVGGPVDEAKSREMAHFLAGCVLSRSDCFR